MKKGKTEILLITDRSGSMSNIAEDMEGGLKTLLEKQKKEPGECYVTHYQFDDVIERVIDNKNIQDVDNVKIVPRGSTALLDCVGKAITEIGERLDKTPENERPELVIVSIVSDGYENASKEFKLDKIKEMIKRQQDIYKWEFIFLGANQDAFQEGQGYGVQGGKSMTYTKGGIGQTMNSTSAMVSAMRSSPSRARAMSYSQEDRDSAAV